MTTATEITPAGQDAQSRSLTEPLSTDRDNVQTLPVIVEANSDPASRTQMKETAPGPLTRETRTSPIRPASSRIVSGLDKWEGKIVAIDGDIFTAELHAIDSEGMPITADFDLDLFGSDAATVVPGDVFYLSVRTVKEPGKTPTRTESLRLRRLGHITPEEVQSMYRRADVLMERIEQLFD